MINLTEANIIRITLKKEEEYMKSLKKNWLSEDEQKKRDEICGMKITNEMRSKLEVFDFMTNPPEQYFLYINEKTKLATTWTGEKLGNVSFNSFYRSTFGDRRVSIIVNAINGKKYYGTYYKSTGDYARIKQYKKQ